MKKLKPTLFLSLLLACILISAGSIAQDKEMLRIMNGRWMGTIKYQTIDLRLVFNISAGPKDTAIVTIDSPDQGAKGIPTSYVKLTRESLVIKSSAIKGEFT